MRERERQRERKKERYRERERERTTKKRAKTESVRHVLRVSQSPWKSQYSLKVFKFRQPWCSR